MDALAFFARLQPGSSEALQNAWFYQHSFNFVLFWSQWMLLLTFRGFRLAAQNPPEYMILVAFIQFYVILRPMADSGKFLRFQSGRQGSEPWLYQESCNFIRFWSQWLIFNRFWGFQLGCPNSSWTLDFTRFVQFYGILKPVAAFG